MIRSRKPPAPPVVDVQIDLAELDDDNIPSTPSIVDVNYIDFDDFFWESPTPDQDEFYD